MEQMTSNTKSAIELTIRNLRRQKGVLTREIQRLEALLSDPTPEHAISRVKLFLRTELKGRSQPAITAKCFIIKHLSELGYSDATIGRYVGIERTSVLHYRTKKLENVKQHDPELYSRLREVSNRTGLDINL